MTPSAWYNEIDPYAAQWLRNLISNKLIMQGEVDERPIQDVRPYELAPFTRCHFFAGIAGWDLALQLSNFPVDRKVWTGSNPCQPFSQAGQARGFDDERHLWPFWHHLIIQCKPPTVFGEQVASKDGLSWLDLVHADLESAGYSVGTADLCAAGVGAPHIRQRLWFVADANAPGRSEQRSGGLLDGERLALGDDADGCSGVGDAASIGRPRLGDQPAYAQPRQASAWSDCDWLPCTDGKARPVEPGTFPLVDGLSFRVGSGSPFEGKSRTQMLRCYGNAIVPQAAAAFIKAYLACRP